MTQQNCPVCGTPNDVTRDQFQLYLKNGQIKQCESCGFPLVPWIQYTTTNPTASGHHCTEPVLQWSKSKWSEIHQLKDELSNKNKIINHLQIELDSARTQLDNKNLDQTTQVAQLDDSEIEETALEVNTENEDLWEQLKPHVNQQIREQQEALAKHVNQQIREQQEALDKHVMDYLNNMRDKIQKDIEARLKEQTKIESEDQTQSDHDSSYSEISRDTLSSTAPDGMDVKTNISSSNVTSSSGDPHSSDWSWLYDRNSADVTRDIGLNIEEVRSQNSPPILTKQQQRGMFWIVKDKSSSSLYLVPKRKARFTPESLHYVEKIFDCQNYNPLEQQDWKLEKPAVVNAFETTEEKWSIQEKGSLLFYARR